ncbi:MAG: helix-turn-helix domain-containing protein [Hyphomicrobium sp.]
MLQYAYPPADLTSPPYNNSSLVRHPGTLSREAIEHAVGQVFGVADKELRRATRGRAKVALARQVAMYLAHVGCGLSLTQTGLLFSRDRTTVAHACGVIEDRRDDPLFDRTMDLLEWAVPALASRPVLHS